MNTGDKVKCLRTDGYYNLTLGQTYTVNKYEDPSPEPNGFTFPAYVSVNGDNGKETWCHASRFEVVP